MSLIAAELIDLQKKTIKKPCVILKYTFPLPGRHFHVDLFLPSDTSFEERCVYSEHRCANHRLNYLTGPNRTTRYIRVVRAFFVVTKGAGGRMDYPSARLTVRTFSPLQLTRPTPGHPAEFEQTRHLVDRVNQWLQVTGE